MSKSPTTIVHNSIMVAHTLVERSLGGVGLHLSPFQVWWGWYYTLFSLHWQWGHAIWFFSSPLLLQTSSQYRQSILRSIIVSGHHPTRQCQCARLWASPVSRLSCGGGGKRAWYALFVHAPSSLGNLHTTPLTCWKATLQNYIACVTPSAVLKSDTISLWCQLSALLHSTQSAVFKGNDYVP